VGWEGVFFMEFVRGRESGEKEPRERRERRERREVVWRCKFARAFEVTQVSKVNH
jgi:hypothetical protein